MEFHSKDDWGRNYSQNFFSNFRQTKNQSTVFSIKQKELSSYCSSSILFIVEWISWRCLKTDLDLGNFFFFLIWCLKLEKKHFMIRLGQKSKRLWGFWKVFKHKEESKLNLLFESKNWRSFRAGLADVAGLSFGSFCFAGAIKNIGLRGTVSA